jgi:hypothetical protein
MISLLTEHTGKCLKVEYLDRIEYDFQKSRVTGPWDHKDSVSAEKFHAYVLLIFDHKQEAMETVYIAIISKVGNQMKISI